MKKADFYFKHFKRYGPFHPQKLSALGKSVLFASVRAVLGEASQKELSQK